MPSHSTTVRNPVPWREPQRPGSVESAGLIGTKLSLVSDCESGLEMHFSGFPVYRDRDKARRLRNPANAATPFNLPFVSGSYKNQIVAVSTEAAAIKTVAYNRMTMAFVEDDF